MTLVVCMSFTISIETLTTCLLHHFFSFCYPASSCSFSRQSTIVVISHNRVLHIISYIRIQTTSRTRAVMSLDVLLCGQRQREMSGNARHMRHGCYWLVVWLVSLIQ
jgi:hypothetical protein